MTPNITFQSDWLCHPQTFHNAPGLIAIITLAKNQLAYRTATLEAAGTVPETLKEILTKAEGK